MFVINFCWVWGFCHGRSSGDGLVDSCSA